jgi:hypothetical protein
MAPPPTPSPDPTCFRCSTPITPGTAAQRYGRPVHVQCLAQTAQPEAIEQREQAAVDHLRASAARGRAEELFDMVRRVQTTCPVCGERLGTSRGVLFQGDQLVHAACWRADPPPV